MNLKVIPKRQEQSFRNRIKLYKEYSQRVQSFLDKNPKEWGRFQSEINAEVNALFRELMNFEKERLAKGDEDSVYKLKRFFVRRLRKEFCHGEYIVWSLKKPYGYAGDHKIIDDIYKNSPHTEGFERLFDNYFQMSAISVAVRNRKEDFKKCIVKFVENRHNEQLRIMDLACGPARDVYELFLENPHLCSENITIDCVDNDEKALKYAEGILRGIPRTQFNFIRENAVRFALKKNIRESHPRRYDLIYSTGLFDYFEDRITLRMIHNLREILNLNGLLAISDVRDKYSNPSVHFMEWVGDWNLVYREDERFRQLFREAGFKENELLIGFEQQGILQYIFATKNSYK